MYLVAGFCYDIRNKLFYNTTTSCYMGKFDWLLYHQLDLQRHPIIRMYTIMFRLCRQPSYWITFFLIVAAGMGPILAIKFFRYTYRPSKINTLQQAECLGGPILSLGNIEPQARSIEKDVTPFSITQPKNRNPVYEPLLSEIQFMNPYYQIQPKNPGDVYALSAGYKTEELEQDSMHRLFECSIDVLANIDQVSSVKYLASVLLLLLGVSTIGVPSLLAQNGHHLLHG
ncbi:uncharacterized protein LOC133783584 [Humulus lupulus]|uniref:uncharacterized protein LOC133783584 n=1 Tax=Humulus lupulus TaxID=3486 RepID=UPI002B408F0F|nr:uncharacterized protein LOC133783584 [Humulus lupulus]